MVDVRAELEGSGSSRWLGLDAIDSCVRVLRRASTRMEGLEATGSVENDPEVTSKWRGKSGGTRFWVNLNQAMLYQASVNVSKDSYAPGS